MENFSTTPRTSETVGGGEVAKRNLFERLMGLLVEPGTTFAAIIARPDLIGPVLLIVLTSLFSIPIFQFATAHLPAEVAEKVSPTTMLVSQAVGTLVTSLIVLFIRALVFYLLGLFTGGGASYKQALSVAGYLNFTACLQMLFTGAALLLTGQYINLGLGFSMSYEQISTPNGVLMSNLNLFVLGYLVLSTIGLGRLLKTSMARAAIFTVILWLIVLALNVGMTSIGARLAGGAA